jgi:Ca2+-binding EF-hand superfamily protein
LSAGRENISQAKAGTFGNIFQPSQMIGDRRSGGHLNLEIEHEMVYCQNGSDARLCNYPWRLNMKWRVARAGQMIGAAMILSVASVGQPEYATAASALQGLDPDHDGTVDLAEAKAAASKLFNRLDRIHDGTLDRRELKGRMTAHEFAAADHDNDGTLDKNEYLAVVEKRFKAANRDNDRTLDAKELSSRPGKALQRLLR